MRENKSLIDPRLQLEYRDFSIWSYQAKDTFEFFLQWLSSNSKLVWQTLPSQFVSRLATFSLLFGAISCLAIGLFK